MSAPWPEKWAGKTWRVDCGGGAFEELVESDLRAVHEWLTENPTSTREEQRHHVLGLLGFGKSVGFSHPFVQRVLRLLRDADLIAYRHADQGWCWRAKA